MDEAKRLACPDCGLVYRIKNLVPGKLYTCRKCGANLRPLDNGVEIRPPTPGDREADIAAANRFASSSAQTAIPESRGSSRRRAEAPADGAHTSDQRFCELAESLSANLTNNLTESLPGRLAKDLSEEISRIEGDLGKLLEKTDQLLERGDGDASAAVSEQIRELRGALAAGLDELREARRHEHVGLIPGPEAGQGAGHLVEIDIDELTDRLVGGIRAKAPRLDAESGSAVDALARVADELVREQNANSTRLDTLAGEIRNAVTSLSGLDDWRCELPARVADEIGRTVEDRVVGPISGALARQAPSILSELQDHKLVDIVSRSVREAQRPLIREILAGGRGGVPAWLFASVLLPLLLVLGYLFLPGGFGGDEDKPGTAAVAAVSDGLARIEGGGVPLTAAEGARLKNIEDVVLDLHGEALAHVKNAAALEEQVKNLNARLEEKEALVNEYRDTLQRQVRLLNSYRTRLTQLGVVPETIQEQ